MDPLELLQSNIYGVLNALAYNADISLHLWQPRSEAEDALIKSQYDEAMAGKRLKGGKYGMAAFVMKPTLVVPEGNAPGPDFEVQCDIRIVENLRANMIATGTQKSTTAVALEYAKNLHLLSLGGYLGVLYCERDSLTELDPLQLASGLIQYDVIVRTRFSLTPPTRVAHVSITGTPAAVTLSTETSGAAIYYTTDGSMPYSGNASATLYSAPFAVASGTTVFAAAHKTGLSQSHVASKTIS